jgi:fluoride exporter
MSLMVLVAIAFGGAIGSLMRYAVASLVQSAAWPGFPWGIFVVNVSGGFIMGIVVELAALKISMTPELRAFLTVGVLGGYTTFSTFSLDSALLIERGDYMSAAAYMAGSAILSVVALFAGLWLVRTI